MSEKQEHAWHQLDAEIQEIDEQTDELLRQQDVWQKELTILKEKRELLENEEEIARINDRIADIERQLDRWEQERAELLEQRDNLISEQKSGGILGTPERLKGGSSLGGDLKESAKHAFKKAAAVPFIMTAKTVKSGVKSAVTKANPFDQKINRNDVADSGVESIRLAYSSVKKTQNGIKTVSSTVKTAQRTIKTAGKAAKTTVKIAYKTPIFIVKTAIKAVRITGTVAANIVAAAMNPVVIIIAAFLLLFTILAGAVVLILGGGASAATSNAKAQAGAVGLINVPEQYQNALDYFEIAVRGRKDEYYTLIDSLYYNYDDLTHSNLVYLERTDASGNKITYQTSFATDERKDTLKAAWDFSADDMHGIIAIAYVYLEKLENEAHGTEGGIYEVTYTQEVFDLIAEQCVNFNDTVFAGQSCGTGCTRHEEEQNNPAYTAANAKVTLHANAYNEWLDICGYLDTYAQIGDGKAQAAYWDNNIQWRIDNWKSVYFDSCTTTNRGQDYLASLGGWYVDAVAERDATPEKITVTTFTCEYQHDLHSIGLWYYSKERIMDVLNFTDNEKEWVNLTEMGFESNPNIP